MFPMAKKDKKKSIAEPANKTRILLKLQKMNAYSDDSAKSLKELGLTDKKKFDTHLEMLESEGKIKKIGNPGNFRYWVNEKKTSPKKKGTNTSFFLIWMVSTFVVIFLVLLVL